MSYEVRNQLDLQGIRKLEIEGFDVAKATDDSEEIYQSVKSYLPGVKRASYLVCQVQN